MGGGGREGLEWWWGREQRKTKVVKRSIRLEVRWRWHHGEDKKKNWRELRMHAFIRKSWAQLCPFRTEILVTPLGECGRFCKCFSSAWQGLPAVKHISVVRMAFCMLLLVPWQALDLFKNEKCGNIEFWVHHVLMWWCAVMSWCPHSLVTSVSLLAEHLPRCSNRAKSWKSPQKHVRIVRKCLELISELPENKEPSVILWGILRT